MDTPKMQTFWFRCFALLVVTLCITWMMVSSDAHALAKIDSMSPAQYITYERGIHSHSAAVHFLTLGFFGALYVGVIELIVYVLRTVSRRNVRLTD